MDTKLSLLKMVRNGWHGDGLSNGNRTSVSFYTSKLDHCICKEYDYSDCIVIDASAVPLNDAIDMSIKGPMVDPSLPDGQISRFGETERKTLFGMLPALGGAFQAIGVLAMSEIGSLDHVARDVYVQMWRERGARIGRVQSDRSVAWMDSDVVGVV